MGFASNNFIGLVLVAGCGGAAFSTARVDDVDFYRESPCVVAELTPYLSMHASDWCAMERAIAQVVLQVQDAAISAERALKLISIRCALLVNEEFESTNTNVVMARFVAYWKTEYCSNITVTGKHVHRYG